MRQKHAMPCLPGPHQRPDDLSNALDLEEHHISTRWGMLTYGYKQRPPIIPR